MSSHKILSIAMGIGLFLCAAPAFAYVDPGSGAMLVQAVLALLAACVFYFRNPSQLWRDVKGWLEKIRKH